MVRSLFVLNSNDQRAVSTRFWKIKEELSSCELKLEGPYRDKGNAVTKLVENLKSRMTPGKILNPLDVVINALVPQNFVNKPLWLNNASFTPSIPFVLVADSTDCDSAGAVACLDAVEINSQKVRKVDPDALTMLGVSMLRRLGIPSFFAYYHFDLGNPTVKKFQEIDLPGLHMQPHFIPCILAFVEETPQIISILPPYKLRLPVSDDTVAGLEVLDDNALVALIQIKSAYSQTKALIRDVSKMNQEFQDEGAIRAMLIGHVLYEGMSAWSVDDAEKSIKDAKLLMKLGDRPVLTSIRTFIENKVVHAIECFTHHCIMAGEEILCDQAKKLIDGLLPIGAEGEGGLAPQIVDRILEHECATRFVTYMVLASNIVNHIHPKSECPLRIASC